MKIRHVLKYLMLIVILVSCSREEKSKISASFVEFSTDIKITVYDVKKSDEEKVRKIIGETEGVFRYFNSELNAYEENSSLSRINNLKPGTMVPVPESLRKILKISQNIYKYTDKTFDIAIQPVVDLWGFNTLSIPARPDSAKLSDLLKISNLESYRFSNDSIGVTDERCRIGFGGIAKGYSVDSAAAFLSSKGLSDFIVAAAGDIIVRSSTPKTIGIRHPRMINEIIDTLYISDAAVSTSGDYEKFLIDGNNRYCHIINPFTGYGTSDCISATVISEKSYMSDAFATAVFVMGREKGRYFIEKNNLSGIIYYLSADGQILSDRINLEKYTSGSTNSGKAE
jgi:thiamine biosynthesis lipoprotein